MTEIKYEIKVGNNLNNNVQYDCMKYRTRILVLTFNNKVSIKLDFCTRVKIFFGFSSLYFIYKMQAEKWSNQYVWKYAKLESKLNYNFWEIEPEV